MPSKKRAIESEEDMNIDFSAFFRYLKSDRGHELASRIVGIIEDLKKAHLEKTTAHAKFEKWLQGCIIVVVVGATTLLTFLGKFDGSIGVLFGTMVGYLFGRRQIG